MFRGNDDYFSSDLPLDPDGVHVHPLSSSFGKLSAPALALCGEKDECYHTDPIPVMDRWVKAANGKLEAKLVPGAGHSVKEPDAQVELCKMVIEWLGRVIE
jgi:pimeloyl-ACP methyl ester carboxylesterase